MNRAPKDIVRSGYDRVSTAYREDCPDESDPSYRQYRDWTDRLDRHIPADSRILDLGCGCGVPVSRLLSQRHRVNGVDLSPVQIERARRLVPDATFSCGDMCALSFAADSFEAIVCLYAIIHVPQEEQEALLAQITSWLVPEGHLLISVGHRSWTGQEQDWLDVAGGTMYWSHADRDTYTAWFAAVGLHSVWEIFVPEGKSGHPLFLLQKQ
jgi:2-polyprenyl-3-methyl-5-hydroxy-6-metoxy-1,4-benzoquinol methylase